MIAKGSGYVRGNRQAAAARLTSHMKYTEHRSRDMERETRDDRRIFSKDQDVVGRKDAVDDVMEHTSTSVNYHKFVLSPGEDVETGRLEPVKMYPGDYQALRESGHEHSEHEWYRQVSDLVKEYDQQEHVEPSLEHDQSREVARSVDVGQDFDR